MNWKDDKVCTNCYWRCYAQSSDENNNRQFCLKRGNTFLDQLFDNYNENISTCEKFKKGRHDFYGKPS